MITRVEYNFPTDLESILKRIGEIDPIKYGRSRNFISGDVTYLSPYISRGVISVNMIKDAVLKRGFKLYQIEKFVQELAWREYWQRIWQNKGDEILTDLKQKQPDYLHNKMPEGFVNASTSIDAIDNYIDQLYEQGYMHNHIRMYVGALACNIAKAHWLQPAKWLYYNLLDGDIASNHLSWQWVCGSASSKKYYCNQENINRYTGSNQKNSFLDVSYEAMEEMLVPTALKDTIVLNLQTILPETTTLKIDSNKPTCIYNSYNLDPFWRKDEDVNRVLLLEPSHFEKYPVNQKVIEFIINLSKNIDGIILHVGEFSDLLEPYNADKSFLLYKEHPAFKHYKGICDSREWMAKNITGSYNSFFSFWKKAGKEIF